MAGCQIALSYPLEERRVLSQFSAVELVGVEEAHRQSEFLRDDPDGFREIRVVRYENSDLESLRISISQQVGCEIDVRAFLFRLVYPNPLRGRNTGQVHRNGASEKVPVLNVEVRYSLERSDVEPLVVSRGRVVGSGTDSCSEVMDLLHCVVRQ